MRLLAALPSHHVYQYRELFNRYHTTLHIDYGKCDYQCLLTKYCIVIFTAVSAVASLAKGSALEI